MPLRKTVYPTFAQGGWCPPFSAKLFACDYLTKTSKNPRAVSDSIHRRYTYLRFWFSTLPSRTMMRMGWDPRRLRLRSTRQYTTRHAFGSLMEPQLAKEMKSQAGFTMQVFYSVDKWLKNCLPRCRPLRTPESLELVAEPICVIVTLCNCYVRNRETGVMKLSLSKVGYDQFYPGQ